MKRRNEGFAQEFGRHLRSARELVDMTQVQLSAMVGVSNNMVSLYENGRRVPSLEIVSRMSTVLDISMDRLVPELSAVPYVMVPEGQTMMVFVDEEEDE